MPSRVVLFVGNSYTLYHDVPSQVARLAEDAGSAISPEMIAEGGAHLGLHTTTTGALERIARGGLAAVVVQDQSTGPLHDRARFEEGVARLARAARAVRAELVWYETWARATGHAVYRAEWSGGTPDAMGRTPGPEYVRRANPPRQHCGRGALPHRGASTTGNPYTSGRTCDERRSLWPERD